MRISDWSSDVCSSDLGAIGRRSVDREDLGREAVIAAVEIDVDDIGDDICRSGRRQQLVEQVDDGGSQTVDIGIEIFPRHMIGAFRSEEHTSELQSLMRISYAVFCLKKTKNRTRKR